MDPPVKIVDCQRDRFSDMVQDSGTAERKREREAEDHFGGSAWVGVGAFGRKRIASAGFAGEFEPRIAGMDWRRSWDLWEHLGYGCVEPGIAVWIDFDQPARAGVFEGATGVRVRRGAGLGGDAEDQYNVWRRSESVRVQVDFVGTKKGEAVL
jgi:hypothetical protein